MRAVCWVLLVGCGLTEVRYVLYDVAVVCSCSLLYAGWKCVVCCLMCVVVGA